MKKIINFLYFLFFFSDSLAFLQAFDKKLNSSHRISGFCSTFFLLLNKLYLYLFDESIVVISSSIIDEFHYILFRLFDDS